METSMSHLKPKHEQGFSMLEATIAVSILAVGMLAVAAIFGSLSNTTTSSRYSSTQTLLASEKLEDLNRLSACDPEIAVPGGGTMGSLTSDASQNIAASTTVCGSETVNYFDDVQISTDNGAITETNNGVTITQTPNGEVTTTAPPNSANLMKYHRRWVIEQDPVIQGNTITGARRITVIVFAQTGRAVDQAAAFQTTMVRQ
jgi:type II secretory pathway pseudopilin PulG